MGISIFTEKEDPMTASGVVRGWQIDEKIGARLNPKSSYKSDLCIYVKPQLDADSDFKFEGKKQYLDIIDRFDLVPLIKTNPKLSVIACSEMDYVGLTTILATDSLTNKVVLIPQHHCNYDREIRTGKEINTVGVIGTDYTFKNLPPDLEPQLSQRGIKLLKSSDFLKRQDVVNFYKSIDLQIVWRPWRKKLANPWEIVNAASFGIPTIAYEEPYFKEMGSCYAAVSGFDEFLTWLDILRSPTTLYNNYSELCLEKAERYHIDNIAKLYEALI
ncbi:MAG: hypothetical protein NTZ07_04270 [Candidatus Woesebacteria bacterium]|nr:hypothetical protein [Candidatus Woesebacteria bacterium]